MKRLVLLDTGDLSISFRAAVNTLGDAEIKIQPGTKLLTRYAVIVVDETKLDEALDHLLSAGIAAQKKTIKRLTARKP